LDILAVEGREIVVLITTMNVLDQDFYNVYVC